MPKYCKPLYNQIKPYVNSSFQPNLIDTSDLLDGAEYYIDGNIFKLFKDSISTIPKSILQNNTLATIAPNGKDVWICEEPYFFVNSNNTIIPQCQYNPSIMLLNADTSSGATILNYPFVNRIDLNQLNSAAPGYPYQIFAQGSNVIVNAGNSSSITLYDSRFLALHAIILQINSINPSSNVWFKNVQLTNSSCNIKFVNPPGIVNISYMTVGQQIVI
jgi:hypothetical protein